MDFELYQNIKWVISTVLLIAVIIAMIYCMVNRQLLIAAGFGVVLCSNSFQLLVMILIAISGESVPLYVVADMIDLIFNILAIILILLGVHQLMRKSKAADPVIENAR